jgi:hypothetical protein
MQSGSVYVARSPDYPGFVKVGFSAQSAASRVKRLSGAGSLARWELVACRPVSDARKAEKTCHSLLEQLNARVQARREFFQIDEASAIRVMDSVARQFPAYEHPSARAGHALSDIAFPVQWRSLVALRRRHSNATVSIAAILREHILQRSHLAESRLAQLGLVCVNRCEKSVTYRADPVRASGLAQELMQCGNTVTAALLTSGALMTLPNPAGVRKKSKVTRLIVQKARPA